MKRREFIVQPVEARSPTSQNEDKRKPNKSPG
jgi:hypothetical protein